MPVDTKPPRPPRALLAVEGVTEKEAAIGRELRAALEENGVPADAIRLDDAIPALYRRASNLIVDLPAAARATSADHVHDHMDTVPLCAGANPKRRAQDRQ